MKIEMLSGAGLKLQSFTVHEFPDGQEVVIGRGEQCHLRTTEPETSRQHARIYWVGKQAYIEDLGSKNGTRLNGALITRAALGENDQIQIGNTVLTVTALPGHPRTSTVVFSDKPASKVVAACKYDEAGLTADRLASLPPSPNAGQAEIVLRISKISERLTTSRNPDATIMEVLNDVRSFLAADVVCMLLWDPVTQEWRLGVNSTDVGNNASVVVSQTMIKKAVTEGQAILFGDADSGVDQFQPTQSIVSQGITSAICAPVRTVAGFGAVLFLARRCSAPPFKVSELGFAAAVAGILGLFFEKEQAALDSRSDGTA